MQPHPQANFFRKNLDQFGKNLDKFGQNFGKIWTNLGEIWANVIKIWANLITWAKSKSCISKNIISQRLCVLGIWTSKWFLERVKYSTNQSAIQGKLLCLVQWTVLHNCYNRNLITSYQQLLRCKNVNKFDEALLTRYSGVLYYTIVMF